MDGTEPVVLSMVICDAIWRDPSNGKHTILGTFRNINSRAFPCRHQIMSIYLEMTDGRGKMDFRLQIVDVDEEREPIAVIENEMVSPDPNAIIEMGIQINNLVFPEPGEYRVQVFSNDTFLIEQKVTVTKVGE